MIRRPRLLLVRRDFLEHVRKLVQQQHDLRYLHFGSRPDRTLFRASLSNRFCSPSGISLITPPISVPPMSVRNCSNQPAAFCFVDSSGLTSCSRTSVNRRGESAFSRSRNSTALPGLGSANIFFMTVVLPIRLSAVRRRDFDSSFFRYLLNQPISSDDILRTNLNRYLPAQSKDNAQRATIISYYIIVARQLIS